MDGYLDKYLLSEAIWGPQSRSPPSTSLKDDCAQKYHPEIRQLIVSIFFLVVLIGLKSTHFHSLSGLLINRAYLMRRQSFC